MVIRSHVHPQTLKRLPSRERGGAGAARTARH